MEDKQMREARPEIVEGHERPPAIPGNSSVANPATGGVVIIIFAIILYLAAVGFAIGGFINAYFDSAGSRSIVGGDAYNYIIFATRGMVWMGAAFVCAVLALGCQIAGHSSAHYYRKR